MFDSLESVLYSKIFWFTVIFASVYFVYLKYVKFSYWKRKGIPHEEPVLLFGNLFRSCLGLTSIGKRNDDHIIVEYREHFTIVRIFYLVFV